MVARMISKTPDLADLDDEQIEDLLQEFRDEHEREPHGSHEFARWYIARAKSCAAQMQMQLDMQGLMVTPDGKIVKKPKEK
jgi:hypothetical protein